MTKKSMFLIISLIIVGFLIIFIANYFGNNTNENTEKVTFNATVIENKGTSILVNPEEGSPELNSSDKIVVRVPIDNATLKDLSEFTEGSKVIITYNGMIMESYPAQINAYDVELSE
ncbi:MAG: DUF3221 domain-containing protein [Sedimentibacter sp.]